MGFCTDDLIFFVDNTPGTEKADYERRDSTDSEQKADEAR